MEIIIEVKESELDEMQTNEQDLIIHIIETLDSSDTELVGYDVKIEVMPED